MGVGGRALNFINYLDNTIFMPPLKNVKKSVLNKIKPSPREEEKIKKFVQELIRVAKVVSGLTPVVCGSIGKFTWLRGDHDIDLFLMFPKDTTRQDMEKLGLEYGKKITEELHGVHKIKYAEHPYVHAIISGFDVDIVPCYSIQSGEHIQSAVDRSPLHLRYVINNLKPDLQDEVRLLKQFCKGVGVYGSDAKHLGLSGYICELLVMKYGLFEDVLKAVSEWKPPTIIFLRKIDTYERIDSGKFPNSPLILIDPTDHNRNAAAVLDAENYIRFVNAAKNFLAGPDKEYFSGIKKKKLTTGHIKKIHQRGTKFIAVRLGKPDVIDDVLYPQLRKSVKRITNMLKHNEFSVTRAYDFIHGKHAYIILELETWDMPLFNKFTGPPIFSQKHSGEFLRKYKKDRNIYGPYIESNRWIIDKPREFTSAASLLKKLVRKDSQALMDDGIPKYIAMQLKKAKIIEHKDFWKLIKTYPELSAFFYEKYFSRLIVKS